MKITKLILIIYLTLLIELFCFAQDSRVPITVNKLIGDTLSLEERNYFSLFPQIEGYRWAVFYLNSDSTVDVKITQLRNGLQKVTTIHRFSVDSLNNHISVKPYDKIGKGAEVIVCDTLGSEISGELLSVYSNSLLLLKSGCDEDLRNLDCTKRTNYSEIQKIVIKDNLNIWLGAGIGLFTSAIVGGFIIHNAEKPREGMFKDVKKYGLWIKIGPQIIFSSIGLISLGALIGSLISSDEVIDSFTAENIKGLSAYSRYPFEELEELKKLE